MNIFSSIVSVIIPFALLAIVIVIGIIISSNQKQFINSAQEIEEGMTFEEVKSIMEDSPISVEDIDDTRVAIWEKSQWLGTIRGGTVTRSVKVTFKDNVVISVATKNLDKSTW